MFVSVTERSVKPISPDSKYFESLFKIVSNLFPGGHDLNITSFFLGCSLRTPLTSTLAFPVVNNCSMTLFGDVITQSVIG